MKIILTRECAAGAHDKCVPVVVGRERHGYGGANEWRCGCDCSHGARQHAPATIAEAYDAGIPLHPADLFGGKRGAR